MMKKMATLIILIFLSLSCAAPGLSDEQKKEQQDNIILAIKKAVYEAEFNRFVAHLGFKESSEIWTKVNVNGCIGRFQFSPATLKALGYGYITPQGFKKNPAIFSPDLQLKVLQQLIKANVEQLTLYITYAGRTINFMAYVGKTINGILITRAGIIAGAHLGGVGGIAQYLSSAGKVNRHDLFNTTIEEYVKEFEAYNLEL
jgi:hypothetical protein